MLRRGGIKQRKYSLDDTPCVITDYNIILQV